jgi:hypothetical protein
MQKGILGIKPSSPNTSLNPILFKKFDKRIISMRDILLDIFINLVTEFVNYCLMEIWLITKDWLLNI